MLLRCSPKVIRLEKHKYALPLSIKSESNGIWVQIWYRFCDELFVYTKVFVLILGGERKQLRANSRSLMTTNSSTTLSWEARQRLRVDSVCARPPAFSEAAVFF